MIMDRLAVQSPEGESLDNCLRSLRSTLKGRESLTIALIEALGRSPTEVSFRAFTILHELLAGGKGGRVIKQTAYRFAQRGFALPPESQAREVALVVGETRRSIAYMAMAEDSCFFVCALVHSPDEPEPLTLLAYFEDDFDRLRFDLTPTSSKGFKELVQKTSQSSGLPLCEIPIRHAARLIFDMIGWTRGERPGMCGSVERLLKPFHDPERAPLAYEVMGGVSGVEARSSDIDVRALSDALPLRWLLLPAVELKPWRELILAAGRSVLVISEEMRFERVEELIRKAAGELCVGARRTLIQRFLEEGALFLHLAGRRVEASSAWAAAQQLARGGDAGDNPFIFQLVAASLRKHWPEDFAAESEPEEAPDDPSGLYRTTESGLIIPR